MSGDRRASILVVDDDASIRRVLDTGLRARGYTVHVAATAQAGIDAAAVEQPDLIVLDLALPDQDGVAVCRMVRQWSTSPIVVLSAHGAEDRKIEALDEGADDFVTKPFSMRELLARIRAALRRAERTSRDGEEPPSRVSVASLTVDLAARVVTVDGADIDLTSTEFDILAHLARNAGRVITHDGLLAAVWGPSYVEEVHYLRVYVSRLRKKLPDRTAELLVTVPRVGYRLELPGDR